jgi:YidC/Oxa1 family membrane protein insertase
MRNNLPNIVVFTLLATGLAAGWWYVDRTFFPKPPPKPEEPWRETILALGGAAVSPTLPASDLLMRSPYIDPTIAEAPKTTPETPAMVAPPPPSSDPPTLYQLGDNSFAQRVILTNQGAGVQQVILRAFDEANRLGLEVKNDDGTPQKLRIIPGVQRPSRRDVSLTDLHNNPILAQIPELPPGQVTEELRNRLTEPSYLMLHYVSEDDPLREPKDSNRLNDKHPSPLLGDRLWTLAVPPTADSEGRWRAVFETELGAPYFLKFRKTYTLAKDEYHLGMTLDIEALPGRENVKSKFRYQLVGPRNLPIEGEWYTTAFRNAMTGTRNDRGGVRRTFEDASSIHNLQGGDSALRAEDEVYCYAAIATQYFASAWCIDDTQPIEKRRKMWDYVRATREPTLDDIPEQPMMADITIRPVSTPLEIQQKPISHQYMIYNGPVKVRLLSQLTGADAVNDALVDRYLNQLTLRTMTDSHSPNFFGRLASAIWWSDLVITFTNVMHSVLGFIGNTLGLPWWVAIVMLTVMVRLVLLIPSRKQQIMMARMQERMAALKPEIEKLQEKYKDNPQLLQQEKTKLMLRGGVNPFSTMSGCLLMFAQMPVFMGLYFCLQESVFFRLSPFAWAPNLAAPDMLFWWSEKIPFIANPENMGSALYLGPYFNILPMLAVALIFLQQKLTMPPPTDEQQEMQQKMMKFMILFMAVFFYKFPSGLSLYFICSTSWGLAERKLIPKPHPKPGLPIPSGMAGAATDGTTANGASGGGFFSRMKSRLEDMQRQADEQSRRQIRNDDRPTGGPRPPLGGSKKDKKKRRGK